MSEWWGTNMPAPAPLHTEADERTAQFIALVQQNDALLTALEWTLRVTGMTGAEVDGWEFVLVGGTLVVRQVEE